MVTSESSNAYYSNLVRDQNRIFADMVGGGGCIVIDNHNRLRGDISPLLHTKIGHICLQATTRISSSFFVVL